MATAMNPEPEQPDTNALSSMPKRCKNALGQVVFLNCKTFPQWVVWRGELEDGKQKKIPYNPTVSKCKSKR